MTLRTSNYKIRCELPSLVSSLLLIYLSRFSCEKERHGPLDLVFNFTVKREKCCIKIINIQY